MNCMSVVYKTLIVYRYRALCRKKAEMKMKENSRKYFYFLASGSILLILGCALLFMWAPLLNAVTNSVILLQPDNKIFHLWKKNPVPLTLEIYMFNWRNPKDIYRRNTKPRFEEIGPFVFRETREKVNITWNHNNSVTFRHLKYWYFDEEKSVANLSTKINSINAVALTAAHLIKDWTYVLKKGYDLSLKTLSHKIYVTKTVGELLFDGYQDSLIDVSKTLPFTKEFKVPDFDKFGWFYTRNGSYLFDGTFNMVTSGKNFGNVQEWNYASNTTFFSSKCNNVLGSGGEFFPAKSTKTKINSFSPDVCRHIPLDYSEEVYVDGTRGYKYVTGERFLDNGSKIPGNECFCNGECIPSGLVNMSSCRYGSPAFASLPHLYSADPYYLDMIEGLHPKKEQHEMFVVLEPTTGIPLQVQARLQLLLQIQPIKHISIYENIPNVFIPVMWFEQTAKIPENLHLLLKLLLHMPTVLQCLAALMIIVGIPCLIHAIFMLSFKKSSKRNSRSKIVLAANSLDNPKESEIKLLTCKENITQ